MVPGRTITVCIFIVSITLGVTAFTAEDSGQSAVTAGIMRGHTTVPIEDPANGKCVSEDPARLVRRGSGPVVEAQEPVSIGPREYSLRSSSVSRRLLDSRTYSGKLRAGDYFNIFYNMSSGSLSYMIPPSKLTANAQAAVAMAPDWLQAELEDTLEALVPLKQDRYANLMLSCTDSRWLDEIAFVIAHLGIAMLNNGTMNADLITENARYIYEIEPYLGAYVDLVDHGTPGVDPGYYTTTRYQILDSGVPKTVEIPKEIYYWFVVHPIGSDDRPFYFDPSESNTATSPPIGVFWRPYYFFSSDVSHDYTEHWVMKQPNIITEAELQGWGPSSHGYFTALPVNPLRIVNDAVTGEPVLMERRRGTGAAKGSYIGTMMPVEKAYNASTSNLMANMLDSYYANSTLKDTGYTKKLAVFMDRNPWGLTVIQDYLDSQGYTYTIFTSADMATADLTDYLKVIFPSAQPKSFYDTLAANKSVFESWVAGGVKIAGTDRYRVIEFHGATDPVDDWTGLEMPGGFQCVPQASNYVDTVTVGGQPLMKDVISNTAYFWDLDYHWYNGNRFVEPDDLAIDKMLNFCTDNMYYSAIEYSTAHPSTDRSVQPAPVLYGHFGHCGEEQDLITAAARAALMPFASTSNSNEDHVWNEFWWDNEWYFVNVDWCDGNGGIAAPGDSQDKDKGGGKDCSMIVTYRGDGLLYDVIDRYSNTLTLNVTITDGDGKPVDGARVLFWSEPWSGTSLWPGYYTVTDKNGFCSAELGDNQNYYLSVDCTLGRYPPGTGTTKVIDTVDAIAGSVFDWDHAFSTTIGAPAASLKSYPIVPMDPWYEIDVQLDATNDIRYGNSPHTANKFTDWQQPGQIDLYVIDPYNYPDYTSAAAFKAAFMEENTASTTCTFKLPIIDNFNIVACNRDSNANSETIDFRVDVYECTDSAVPASGHSAVCMLLVLCGAVMILAVYQYGRL